eukprot:3484291-Amphidinium_carterae.1
MTDKTQACPSAPRIVARRGRSTTTRSLTGSGSFWLQRERKCPSWDYLNYPGWQATGLAIATKPERGRQLCAGW